jgi:hypothetical protein
MVGEKNPFYNKKHSDESKQKISEKNKGNKAWNKDIPRTDEEKQNISIRTKEAMSDPEIRKKLKSQGKNQKEHHPGWKGGYYSKKIPLYTTYMPQIYYAEECRQSPSDKNILEVRCAYCGNWFIPTTIQVYERIRCLNNSASEGRFYCSNKCKEECPIFKQKSYPKGYKPATSREVQPDLRQMRFEIDNYICQKCGKHQSDLSEGLHCHHLEGIRWEPLESADIDKVITYCKNCHKKAHKTKGCNYNDMICGQ